MSAINVKLKKLRYDATIPTYATAGAAGFDLYAAEDVIVPPGATVFVPLGYAFEIPPGYVMYVCMRSGIALSTLLRQPNGIGVIDSDYRGEVSVLLENVALADDDEADPVRGITTLDGGWLHWDIGASYVEDTYLIRKGDRVCQGVIQPVTRAIFTESDDLSETDRGSGGFGSTGVEAVVFA